MLTYDVRNESVNHDSGQVLPDDDAKDFHVLQVGGQLVVRYDPSLRAEENLHPLLLDVWVLLAELVREPERHYGQAGSVVL